MYTILINVYVKMFSLYCQLVLAAIQMSNYTSTDLWAEIPPEEARGTDESSD